MPLAALLIATSLVLSSPAGTSRKRWPNPLADPLRILRIFDLPNGEYQAGHRGVDVRSEQGATVTAPVAGVVHFEGEVVGRGVLTVETHDGVLVSFEPVVASVTEGDAIDAGQVLGVVEGSTHCGASCLHFGVRVNGEYVNPLRYLAVERPRLLPLNDES